MGRCLSYGTKDYIIKLILLIVRNNSTKIENFFLQKGPHTKVTVFGSIKSTQLARFVQRFGIKKIKHVVIYAMAVCTMNAWAKTFTTKKQEH